MAYEKYFSPLKHETNSLIASANQEGDKLRWLLPLIVKSTHKIEKLSFRCFSISMKKLKRIFGSSDSAKCLSFERCNFVDTTSLKSIDPPTGWRNRRKITQDIDVKRCTFTGTQSKFNEMIGKFYPEANIQILM
ncbi:unnamed protein product [Moneuplotes crassus]|uniref:Uncharacterized protein n=1 Tax=Euplotes crassus TaxID=5936 RepID=A0AAD1XQ73_EUPCR|nr:unnamed protein product [Moneuplotes crassus]